MAKETAIKPIRNYYGKLYVKEIKGQGVRKFYMRMNCEINNNEWREITQTLYNELIKLNS